MLNSDFYFEFLLKYLSESDGLAEIDKTTYWSTRYLELKKKIAEREIDSLPQIMPLIYPTFLYNSMGDWLGELTNYDDRGFANGLNAADNCQFNVYLNIRGKCQADHFWPHSLGGPSILGNRIILCKFHNLAKSNSILETFWLEYPTWINDYLDKLYNLKK
jgi:hypothetical protein